MRLLLILLLLATTLQAEDSEPRSIKFSIYGQYPVRNAAYLPVSASAIAAGIPAQPAVDVKSHNLSRTGPYVFTGDDLIEFFDVTSKAPIARVRVPATSDEWLLVFVKNPKYAKDPENQLRFFVYPFDDSKKHLPNNSLIFLNISGRELAGLIEGKSIKLGMGESSLRSAQESMPINLWSRGFNSRELLPALIKTYQFDKDQRYLMIFFPPVLKGSTDLDVRVLGQRTEIGNERL